MCRVGISTETGNKVWDPLGLSAKMDEGNLKLMRAAELKHCRVAMLANVGWAWTATGTHFEGMLSKSKGITFAELAELGNPILAAEKVRMNKRRSILVAGSYFRNNTLETRCINACGARVLLTEC